MVSEIMYAIRSPLSPESTVRKTFIHLVRIKFGIVRSSSFDVFEIKTSLCSLENDILQYLESSLSRAYTFVIK